MPPAYTLADARRVRRDNISAVDRAISLSLGVRRLESARGINGVRGSHVPSDGYEYALLMNDFGFHVREGGPSEDLYALFSHYPMNPYQPSAAHPLVEDLTGRFAEVPQGPVIGVAGVHKGIYQDFTLPAARALFLVELINWRFQDRIGAPDRIWDFGIAAHSGDLAPGSATALAYPQFMQWLIGELDPLAAHLGRAVYQFDTQYEVGLELLAWRKANPSRSSFTYPAPVQDWAVYPYLDAPARELAGARLDRRLPSPSLVDFRYLFDVDGVPVVLAWKETPGITLVDMTSTFGTGSVRILGAETDTLLSTDPSRVPVGQQPVIVAF